MSDIDIDLGALEKRMDGALVALKNDLASLRTGRASSSMLDAVMVEAYGAATPLNQVGSVSVPEPRMLTISVWDKTMIKAVEKAIMNSGLGLNPQTDGTLIRLPIPELNEERRREMTKVAGDYAERARVSVRNVRRDGMDQIKKAKNDGLSEDDVKLYEGEVQELTNRFIAEIDKILEGKTQEMMTV